MASTLLGLGVSLALLGWADQQGAASTMDVYLAGNWPAPYGIVLALDRLSAMMLVLTSTIALASSVFAAARWHRAGVHFHPLFQLQLMGLCGAFLTADLFNLFVFFEIMLAASYGLLLHGSGRARVQSGLHFIAINLAASSLFLIGASMLYGITGTLNMADLAQSIPLVAEADRGLLHAAAGILATAFLIKAAIWPLNFWLVPAYSAATAPVGALFALMTKVGIYVILRLWLLLFGIDAGPSAQFGSLWLIVGGMVTMVFGAIGMLGSQRIGYLAGYGAILSSGSLLAAAGFGQPLLTAGLLYYLPSSTLAISALFLLADLMDRWRNDGASLAPFDDDEAPFLTAELVPAVGLNLDQDEEVLTGQVIPAAVALLGLAFMACTLVITGLPPLSGFVGKFAMLTALLNPFGLGQPSAQPAGRGGLDAGGAVDRHRPAGPDCADACRHPAFLGDLRPRIAAAARARRPADCLFAGRLRAPDAAGRPGHALHAGHRRCAARARTVCAGGDVRPADTGAAGATGRTRQGSAMKKILPAPLLSAALFVLWLLLNRTLGAGHVLLALVLALAIPAADRRAAAGAGAHPQAGRGAAPAVHGGRRLGALEHRRDRLAAQAGQPAPSARFCAGAAGPARPECAGGAGPDCLPDPRHRLGRAVAGPRHLAAACA